MKDKLVGVFDVPTQLVHGITMLSGHDLHVAFRLMRGRKEEARVSQGVWDGEAHARMVDNE